jgi:hypothetical protein
MVSRQIPPDLYDAFTMGRTIPVFDWFFDDRGSSPIWTLELIEHYRQEMDIDRLRQGRLPRQPYPGAAQMSVTAIDRYLGHLNDRRVAIIGSGTPWLEAMVLNYGCQQVTTVEYQIPICQHPSINTVHYDHWKTETTQYNLILSYSSVEHTGLGRYGDPLNPNGDLETMNEIRHHLSDDGFLMLGVPVGADALSWNGCRVYGQSRLPLLLEGFHEIQWLGVSLNYVKTGYPHPHRCGPQPLIVLRKKSVAT